MQGAKSCEANLIVGGGVVSGVHCGVPILERSFSTEPLQLPIHSSCAVLCAAPYLPGYQHCPRSLTRLAYLCLGLPTSPAYSSCIAGPPPAQLCILSNDCDISAPDISIVVSDSSSSAHNILLGHHIGQTTKSLPAQFCPPCIPKSAVAQGTATVRKSVQQEV